MEVLGKNKVKVKIGGEDHTVLITLGKDLKITEIIGRYLSEVSDLTQSLSFDENTLKNVLDSVEGEDVSDSTMESAKEFMGILDRSNGNSLTVVATVSSKMQNARVQVCSELLAKYNDKGEKVEVITPEQLLNSEKYSDEDTVDEIMFLFGFATERFYNTLNSQEEKVKKLRAKKGKKKV